MQNLSKCVKAILLFCSICIIQTITYSQNDNTITYLSLENKEVGKGFLVEDQTPAKIKTNTGEWYKGDLIFKNDSIITIADKDFYLSDIDEIRLNPKSRNKIKRILYLTGLGSVCIAGLGLAAIPITDGSAILATIFFLPAAIIVTSIGVAIELNRMNFKKSKSWEFSFVNL